MTLLTIEAPSLTPVHTPLPTAEVPNRAVLELGRVALVHDWLNQRGGAENVLEELVVLFPGAPVFTSLFAPERMPAAYGSWDVRTTFMQALPGAATHHQAYLPLYPAAFQSLNLSDYDLVLSNKSGFCHGVRTGDVDQGGARHVCYCLTPTRYLWLYDQYREREQIGGLASAALQPMLARLREWDYEAAQRVDDFIAISTTVRERIECFYGRTSTVIYPPVDTERFTPDPDAAVRDHPGDFFLIVSRLIPYKRIDLAVAAMARLPQRKLVIVGEGRDFAGLRAQAPANVYFLGRQSVEVVRDLMRRCAAFLFPGLEDFGIAPVEAMACGRPVIAFAGGGALDTVLPGATGLFFHEQRADALATLLERFDAGAWEPAACRAQAERFSSAAFRSALLDFLAARMTG